MRIEGDGMMLVRAELCDRLTSLRAQTGRRAGADFSERVDGIRRIALAYGLEPVARLAAALERAVAENGGRDPRGCQSDLYLSRLEDAIGCERLDEAASEALLASVSVRFGG